MTADTQEKAKAFFLQGVSAMNQQDWAGAAIAFETAQSLAPGRLSILINLAAALGKLGRYSESRQFAQQALEGDPTAVEAYVSLGAAAAADRKHREAISHYETAIRTRPDYAEAWCAAGMAYDDIGQYTTAIQKHTRALELNPRLINALIGRALSQEHLKNFDAAIADYDAALAIEPTLPSIASRRLSAKLGACQWDNYDAELQIMRAQVAAGEEYCNPFLFMYLRTSPAEQLECAQQHVDRDLKFENGAEWKPWHHNNSKIRIGYYSADFHNHATSHLLAGVLESHNRDRFEINVFSYGSRADEWTSRIGAAADRFMDVSEQSDDEIAELSRQFGIDIAVDLKGFTYEQRAGIFMRRAAPLQVNYLGYPGTLGAPAYDYIIADRTIIPESERRFYSEKVAHLPYSYQPNDAGREISNTLPRRAAAGLPDDAFVFCSFNQAYKFSPDVFAVWMELLKAVPKSVLWLIEPHASIKTRLRAAAAAAGVASERIVFAPPMSQADHLARHRLADLFLDCFACGAHTTASDALWAGLPVLTVYGSSFITRVAASLLRAINLPELVTGTAAEYFQLALSLAQSPAQLDSLKARLQANRISSPLFDTSAYTADLERVYTAMQDRQRAGGTPDHIG